MMVFVSRPRPNYLVEHSAGSGKSITIAWLAYRLSTLGVGSRYEECREQRPSSGPEPSRATIVAREDGRLPDCEFDWDDANRNHVLEAGVWPEEAEEAFLDPRRVPFDVHNVRGEGRRWVVGAAENGRILFVVWTWRRPRVRIVTGREASARQKRRYRSRGK